MKDLKLYKVDVTYSTYICAHKNESIDIIEEIAETYNEYDRDNRKPIFTVRKIQDLDGVDNFNWLDSIPRMTSKATRVFNRKEDIKELFEDDYTANDLDGETVTIDDKTYKITLLDD